MRTLLYTLAVLLVAPVLVSAQERWSSHYEHLKVFEPLVGEAEGESRFGLLKGKGKRSMRWASDNRNSLVYHESYTFDAEDAKAQNLPSDELVLSGIIGWDTASKKIKSVWFSSFGDHAVTYLTPKGNTLVGERKQTYRNGRTDPYEWVWVIGDDGTLVYESTSLISGSTGRIEYGPTGKSETGPDYEHLNKMEWMIGDWEGNWKIKEGALLASEFPVGATVKSRNTYSWLQNKNYISLEFRDEVNGKTMHEGLEIIGWDSKEKKPTHWLYSIIGGSGGGEWSRDGETWMLDWSYTAGDGSSLEGIAYLTPIDVDTHTWQIKHGKLNGEDIPDTPVVTFHRVKSSSGN